MINIQETECAMDHLSNTIERKLETMSSEKLGFVLIVFQFHQPGIANYASNAEREGIIESLRGMADTLEKKQDIPRTIGTA